MQKISLVFLLSLLFSVFGSLSSQAEDLIGDLEKLSSFQNIKLLENLDLKVPTVLEVPFSNDEEIGYDLAVLENETQEFQPWYLHTETLGTPVTTSDIALIDQDTKTYVEYELPLDGKGTVEIVFTSQEPFKSSSLSFLFDKNVAFPTHIAVSVLEDGTEKTVLARMAMKNQTVNFPETESTQWTVRLEYGQLLRISEMKFIQNPGKDAAERGLRFLAQPGSSYTVYFNADSSVDIETGEAGNLSKDEGVELLPLVESQANELYKKTDTDKDGIPNESDNCVSASNPNQSDVNENGRGDECDDYDQDGVINEKDNCQNDPNLKQEDNDGDGIGDVCDEEESRLTEKYSWLPWLGMGLAALIVVALFYKTAKGK